MQAIEIGAQREEVVRVDGNNAISFLGLEAARVLSTPHMIGYMERTSRNLVFPMLEAGFDTVGTLVNIAHIGAAPMGSDVTFQAAIESVDNRRVNFRVAAFHANGKIGEGTHQRFIINVARFAEKLKSKT